jgi:hypothetical protein
MILPEGPSCTALRIPELPKAPALPEAPDVFQHKDLKVKLKKLKQFKELKRLEVLSQDEQQKHVIIIQPGSEPEITISS